MKYTKALTKTGDELDLKGLTVLVGPNNSGKSTTLNDIYGDITNDRQRQKILVDSVGRDEPPTEEILLEEARAYNYDGDKYRGMAPDLRNVHEFSVELQSLPGWVAQEFTEIAYKPYRENFGRLHVAKLGAESRLELAKSTPSHDVSYEGPSNLVQSLYGNEEVQKLLNKAFRDTFSEQIRFDYTSLKNLYLRVAPNFDNIPQRPEDANRILVKIPSLDIQGDGMRSFTAVVLSVLLASDRLILLDEPDAFLHPEQARRMGRWIAETASKSNQQIIIATHNSHFLQGLISGGTPQIIRLNRRAANVTEFNKVPSDTVRKFAADPLLSSQRVIEAIFHKLTVVCEGDADRTIYQAVASKEHNNNEVLFVNAQNKQTCARVVEALKEAGIAARSVVDFDMLRDKHDLEKIMTAHSVPAARQAEFQAIRKEAANAIEESEDSDAVDDIPQSLRALADQITEAPDEYSKRRIESGVEDMLRVGKWDGVKHEGLTALEEEVKTKTQALIDGLFQYGIAIVPVGELESWIDLQAAKNRWVEPALQRIYDKQTPSALKGFVEKLLAPVQ